MPDTTVRISSGSARGYPRFVYVDRVVVASSAGGRGYARRLYLDLLEDAVRAGHERVVCEINRRPPNPESDAFHAALGFVDVGSASIHNDSKTVRYLLRALTLRALQQADLKTPGGLSSIRGLRCVMATPYPCGGVSVSRLQQNLGNRGQEPTNFPVSAISRTP